MRSLRLAAVAALLLLALLAPPGLAQSNVNGGRNCRYYTYRDVNSVMRDRGVNDTAAIDAAITSTSYVNGWLCAGCRTPRMQMKNFGLVDPNRGECWCSPGYGYYEIKRKDGTIRSRWIGCNKCRPSNTTTNPTTGPYDPKKKSWTATVCK